MAEGGETGIPGIEEQKQFISNQLQRPLVKDEKWYDRLVFYRDCCELTSEYTVCAYITFWQCGDF